MAEIKNIWNTNSLKKYSYFLCWEVVTGDTKHKDDLDDSKMKFNQILIIFSSYVGYHMK